MPGARSRDGPVREDTSEEHGMREIRATKVGSGQRTDEHRASKVRRYGGKLSGTSPATDIAYTFDTIGRTILGALCPRSEKS